MGHLTRVNSPSSLSTVLQGNELVMIKFTAAWCGPCKAVEPLLEQLQDKFTSIKFIEIDVDESQMLASRYTITGMPTFVFVHKQKEISRVRGVDMSELIRNLTELQAKNPSAVRNDGSSSSSSTAQGSSSSTKSVFPKELRESIPKGFEVLNDLVMFAQSELLNVSGANTDTIRGLLDLSEAKKPALVRSDADSQLMVYLPLQNKVKLHSIYIKSEVPSETPEGVDDDLQPVSSIKVWSNTLGPLSFDDASSGLKATHSEDLAEKQPKDGSWHEIKLRFVHFQNVSSVLIFMDGSDEDASTIIDKIVLVGHPGDSKDQGKLEKLEEP